MEEKAIKFCCSFWTFFGRRNNFKFFLRKSNNSKNYASRGFTLIEILVVLGLIGVITGAFIILIDPVFQLKKARDAHRKSDLRQIQGALEIYRADCGGYPNDVSLSLPSPLTSSSCAGFTGAPVTYMQNVPTNPTGGNYTYDRYPAGGYGLSTCLENAKDPEGTSGTCPSPTKDYSVSNP